MPYIGGMSLYIDKKYANQISFRLQRYAVKTEEPFVAAFRCPYCGDSQKNEAKTRGNLFSKDGALLFHCYNCGTSRGMYKFLSDQDSEVAKSYLAETVFERRDSKRKARVQRTEKPDTREEIRVDIDGLKRLDAIRKDHPILDYVRKRMIPEEHYKDMYYTKTFSSWVNDRIPNKLDPEYDEPRIVIPFFDAKKKLFGVTGRSLKSQGLRYITIMFDDQENKIFGLDRIDFTKPYTIVEGAIDSFFLKNSLAMAGADAKIDELPNRGNMTVVYDCEPRNAEIVGRMRKDIAKGYKVCIWPSTIQQKDVNAMVMAGVKDIDKIIAENTYSGLMAETKLAFWAKTKRK